MAQHIVETKISCTAESNPVHTSCHVLQITLPATTHRKHLASQVHADPLKHVVSIMQAKHMLMPASTTSPNNNTAGTSLQLSFVDSAADLSPCHDPTLLFHSYDAATTSSMKEPHAFKPHALCLPHEAGRHDSMELCMSHPRHPLQG